MIADLEENLHRCTVGSGKQLTEIKDAGDSRFSVIRDPAGAVFALMQLNTG